MTEMPELSAASQRVLESPHISQLALPAGSIPKRGNAFDLFFVGQVVDSSGSMRFRSERWMSARDSHNSIVEELVASPFGPQILFYTVLLDGTVINNFARAKSVVMLDEENYPSEGLTPLIPQTQTALGVMFRMAKEIMSGGSTVRMSLRVLTDGAEQPIAPEETAADTRALAADWELLKHSLNGVGIVDKGFTPEQCFATFARMGIKKCSTAGDPEALADVTAQFTTETLALMGAPLG